MPYSLTAKQHELLEYIRARLAVSHVAPSYEEMMRHLGLASKSGVARLVDALVERGHLDRIPSGKRSVTLRLPTEPSASPPAASAEPHPSGGIRLRLGPVISARLMAHCRQYGTAPEHVVLAAITASIGGRP